MQNILIITIITIALYSCSSKAEEKMASGNQAIPVKLISIKEEAADNLIHVTGYLSTQDETFLSFKTGGVIDRIYVKEGDKVQKGQLLATTKSTEISAQVEQVQLTVQKAERDYQRVQNLYNDSVATLEQLQNAKTGVEIARKSLSQASFNQQYSRIYATQDGFIIRKLKNDGELSEPGSPVLKVGGVSGSSGWVLATSVSDREWSLLEKGDSALITLEAFAGKNYSAIVSKKALAVDPVDGSFPIELKVSPGNEQFATGMFGKGSIKSSRKQTGYSIPYESLLEANGKKGFVFASRDGKTVKKVEVIIGQINDKTVQVISGLDGYTYLVSSGSPYLNDKSVISVIK